MKKILFFAFAFLLFVSCSNKPNKLDAFVESQEYVRDVLNYPIALEFTYNRAVDQIDEHTFDIDALASYEENGTAVHKSYICTVTYNNDFTERTISNFEFY